MARPADLRFGRESLRVASRRFASLRAGGMRPRGHLHGDRLADGGQGGLRQGLAQRCCGSLPEVMDLNNFLGFDLFDQSS